MTTWDMVNLGALYCICIGALYINWQQNRQIKDLFSLIAKMQTLIHQQNNDSKEVFSYAENVTQHANFWYTEWYKVVVNQLNK